jgi:hypothetical protein
MGARIAIRQNGAEQNAVGQAARGLFGGVDLAAAVKCEDLAHECSVAGVQRLRKSDTRPTPGIRAWHRIRGLITKRALRDCLFLRIRVETGSGRSSK